MNQPTPLDTLAQRYVTDGWKITTIDSQRFTATKKKSPNGLAIVLGLVGLLFYIVPGLLILLLAYIARGEETVVFTAAQAEELIAEERGRAEKQKAEEALGQETRDRNVAAQQKAIADMKDRMRRVWASIRGRSTPG